MKRLFCLITVCLMVITGACAESIYASMTDEQLLSVITAARKELSARADREYLIDNEDLRIYKTGENLTGTYTSGSKRIPYYQIEVVIENTSDHDFELFMENVTINGWNTTPLLKRSGIIESGMKRKCYFEMLYAEADLTDYNEIIDVTFSFYIGDLFNKEKEYKFIMVNEG